MAIYDLGTASLAANGEVTGVGTTWKAPLTLIRVGATIVFKTEPVQIYTISEIISDAKINVYNPNSETVPAGTGYAILAHDGITVQGLAQDVAETLRYYQSRETEVASAVDAFNQFDADAFQQNVTNVNNQSQQVAADAQQVSSDKAQVSSDKDSAAASAAIALTAKESAEASAAEAADSAASLNTDNLLKISNSLSDLTDKALSRSNLDVYSKSESRSLKDSSDISNFGYVYGSGVDAKDAVLSAVSSFGKATLSGDVTLSRFDWPQGARIEGKSNITYTRLPGVDCVLDSSINADHSLMKAIYVHQVHDICDMIQLKTAGFNTIIHYGQFGSSGGTMEKACNAAEAVGINLILGGTAYGQTNNPSKNLDSRGCVVGYYLFDEPQNNSITRTDQETRIQAFKAFTSKMLCIAEHGIYGYDTSTHPSGYNGVGYDIIFTDAYYHDDWDDARNKRQAVIGYSEMIFKCPNAKLIPCVGLFTTDANGGSDNFKNKAKQISFAKQFYGFSDGNYCAFAWESNLIANTHRTPTNDTDLYKLARDLNSKPTQKPYEIDVYVGFTNRMNGINILYNKDYSSADVFPWATTVGGTTSDRVTTFARGGIAARNSGGNFCTRMKSHGYVAVQMYFLNGADSTDTNVAIRTSPDDFYSFSSIGGTSATLNLTSTSWIASGEVTPGVGIAIAVIPLTASARPWKIINGGIIDCSWRTSSF